MPKVFLPIALMVLGTIKLPGEHSFSDPEAEHALEQLERLGHPSPEPPQLPIPAPPAELPISERVTPHDALEMLAMFMEQGEISPQEVAERLGFAIGMVIDDEKADETPKPEEPVLEKPAQEPAKAAEPEHEKPADMVIPPAVVKELVKAGFVITKPETIQTADDEALLAVKGMTPELLARVRQIAG